MVGIIKAVPRGVQVGSTLNREPIYETQYKVFFADGSIEFMPVREYLDLLNEINKPADGVL